MCCLDNVYGELTKKLTLNNAIIKKHFTLPSRNKSLWLLKHKPEVYPQKSQSRYEDKLAEEGYEVQQNVTDFLLRESVGRKYVFNEKFKTADGSFAEADIISPNNDGSVNYMRPSHLAQSEMNI